MKKHMPAKAPVNVTSRKATRKQKRQQKKINRQEHYLKNSSKSETSSIVGQFVRRPPSSIDNGHPAKKKKIKNMPSSQDLANKERERERKTAMKLQSEMEEQRRNMLIRANEDEDKIIKKLEKQLGLKKTKNIKNLFADDGLDYLLEVCDRTTQEQIVAAEKHLANVDAEDDFDDDLAVVTGKTVDQSDNLKSKKSKKDPVIGSDENEDLDSNEFSDDEDDDLGDSEDDISDEEVEKEKKTFKRKNEYVDLKQSNTKKGKLDINTDSELDLDDEDEFSESDLSVEDEQLLSDDNNDEVSNASQEVSEEKDNAEPDMWEDIYGRKRDTEGNVVKEVKGAYVPPHLRIKNTDSEDKVLAQLKRQIKGVLNKLAGTNLHWACSTIEALYSNSSRHAVNTALSDLWIEALVQHAATPDRMVAEHAALISVLQANVGMEVGAHFLQILVKKFDNLVNVEQSVENKELDNLVSALAHLYSFKIFDACLLYDILTKLLDTLAEKNLDCVLVALRCVGGALRKDDPAALKTFIQDTQSKVAALSGSAASGSRIKFLLEVLLAVKNNNLNKIPNYDPSYCDHLRKFAKGIFRKGNFVTTLNIRLQDLLKADEKGKWWVVGSAWDGTQVQEKAVEKPVLPSISQELLELARRQRMNTDIRRSIFCIIMSAEDYMDAFEKLQHLGLKNQQEREIVHVLLACCLQESTYNPYYGVLAQKLCDYDRKFQLSIQYAVWDKFKDLADTSKVAIANLAQFLTHLVMEKGLPLSVLKVIEFSDLNKSTVRFMRRVLLAIIMNADLQATLEVFQRISKAPKLHMFRESLRLFIQHFLVRNAGKKTSVLSEEEMDTLKDRTRQVEKILTLHDSKMKF